MKQTNFEKELRKILYDYEHPKINEALVEVR
jgi:hypothetical protein